MWGVAEVQGDQLATPVLGACAVSSEAEHEGGEEVVLVAYPVVAIGHLVGVLVIVNHAVGEEGLEGSLVSFIGSIYALWNIALLTPMLFKLFKWDPILLSFGNIVVFRSIWVIMTVCTSSALSTDAFSKVRNFDMRTEYIEVTDITICFATFCNKGKNSFALTSITINARALDYWH